ncbi:RCC1 domain-containing protein [Cohnella herbarum]|uniref:SLH domain-containing protein n=1 Tax=Cohnella herbarum TaxID=2728023 RepID=A0A7Z2ZLF7_9BACL|nr:S-layer homology domain-containing protein [Cohnella herbarum]QJD83839.1 hypothetical protein HH215_12035 [Cohnella herbarum]
MKKRIESLIALVVMCGMILSIYPSIAAADNSACAPNFTTNPMVAGGGVHTVALKSDGTVWSWGENTYGQLGDGTRGNGSIFPVKAQALCDIVAISGGWAHTVALKSDGTVWTWGNNEYGQLGYPYPQVQSSAVPMQVKWQESGQVIELSDVVAIDAGSYHTVALKRDGTVWTWGNNYKGELGYETDKTQYGNYYLPSSVPKRIPDLTGVKAIAAGFGVSNDSAYTAALKNDGTVWTWGSNRYGALGYDTQDPLKPQPVPSQVPDVSDIASIAAGSTHVVALKTDGTVWAWGSNEEGQLGSGGIGYETYKLKVRHPLDSSQELNGVVSMNSTGSHTLVKLNDGTVWAWGRNIEGQIGDGSFNRAVLAQKPLLNGSFTAFGSGWGHSIAVIDDGTVWTWGLNARGQLGYDTSIPEDPGFYPPSNAPRPVEGFSVYETPSDPTLTLSGKNRLPFSETMELTALLYNPGNELTRIRLQLTPGPGLRLVDNDAVQTIDRVASGTGVSKKWRARAEEPGMHSLTVQAFRENETVPFVEASYQIEALASVVPPGVALEGFAGARSDGTPVAIRSSLLTIDVGAACQSVRLYVKDPAGNRREIGRQSPPAAVFSFTPSLLGMEQSPLTVEIESACLNADFPIELIDPSGVVYNAEQGMNWPLPGATVVLEYYDPALSEWVQMSEEAYQGRLSPTTNPQLTGGDGRYAWDVAAGAYRVRVSRPGFAPVTSDTVNVPPPVTDLHVGLTPVDKVVPSLSVTGVTYGATYSQSVTVRFQAADDASGVRYVSYRLNQGAEQRVNGDQGALTVSARGSHVIDFTVADHAGNLFTSAIAFKIADTGGSNPGGSTGGGGSSSNGATSLRILIDGKAFENIATVVASKVNGADNLAVKVDAALFAAQLAKAGNKPVIAIPVSGSASKVTFALAGDAVKAMENKQAVLELRTPLGNYRMPSEEFRIDSLAKRLGDQVKLADVLVHTDIAKSGPDKVKLADKAASDQHFTVVVPPAEFYVLASSNGKSVEADKFETYVAYEIPLPKGALSGRGNTITALALEADGTVHHAPTSFASRDGIDYAVVRSLLSGTYFVVNHPKSFADVKGHWAEKAVNDLASRMIVKGVDDTHYRPNAVVTRAEFAAILVRALGIADNGQTSAFTDVGAGDWFAGAVAKAQEYRLVEGDARRKFHPTKSIARQEAIVMIVRAMKLAGLNANIGAAEADAEMSKFADGAAVAAWAKEAFAAAVKNGIVGGSNGKAKPASAVTRAETAAIVQRLLEKSKLIGDS